MFLWPVPGYLTVSSGYYDQRSYGLHGAIDIDAPKVPTVAVGAGRIIFVGWAGDAGLSVYLDMGNWRAHYCHLFESAVSAGQVVQAGDVIGTVGKSTRGTHTWPGYPNHLHLNLFTATQPTVSPSHWVGWVGMWCVDPELYLSKEGDMPTVDQLQAWATAHDQGVHKEFIDPKLIELENKVKILEARPTGSGVSEERVKALIRAARHTI